MIKIIFILIFLSIEKYFNLLLIYEIAIKLNQNKKPQFRVT